MGAAKLAAPAPAVPAEGRLVLMLAGDVMTGRGLDQAMRHPVDPALHEDFVKDARQYLDLAESAHGPVPRPMPPAYPWGAALAEIEDRAPDLRIINLETAITAAGAPWPGKDIHYRMHPDHVDCLRAAKIDACVLADNHVADWGLAGLTQTLDCLQAAGVQTAGAGRDTNDAMAPACWPWPERLHATARSPGGADRGGTSGHGRPAPGPRAAGRVLLFALAEPGCGVPRGWAATAHQPGVALLPDLSAGTAQALIRHIHARRRAGDVVIVSLHWGGNWGLAIAPAQRDFAHRLIDAGAADLVHGHSSHHPMPFEVYGERLVLYGCGDLLNDYEGIHQRGLHGDLPGDIGCLYFAQLQAASGALVQLEIVPFERRRLRLVAASAAARLWLTKTVLQPSVRTRGGWQASILLGGGDPTLTA